MCEAVITCESCPMVAYSALTFALFRVNGCTMTEELFVWSWIFISRWRNCELRPFWSTSLLPLHERPEKLLRSSESFSFITSQPWLRKCRLSRFEFSLRVYGASGVALFGLLSEFSWNLEWLFCTLTKFESLFS